MILLLDTTTLGRLCHPNQKLNRPLVEWLKLFLAENMGNRVFVGEMADYEVRRKLLHLIAKGQADQRSLERLDSLARTLRYLPITTAVMRHGAQLWAESRLRGQPTGPEESIDGDVILSAQAKSVNAIVVTDNTKHFQQFVIAASWQDLAQGMLEKIPYVEGEMPPRGYILVQTTDGDRVWARPEALKRGPVRSELSEEQLDRLRGIFDVVAPIEGGSWISFLDDFMRDVHPDHEIRIWERITEVFRKEESLRGNLNDEDRRLLFGVIVRISMGHSVDELLATIPQAKRLRDLERVIASYKEPLN